MGYTPIATAQLHGLNLLESMNRLRLGGVLRDVEPI